MPKGYRYSWAKRDRLGSVAKKVTVMGEAFPSKLEAAVWLLLKAEESQGKISGLKRYPSIRLTKAGIGMKPDFAFFDVELGCYAFAEAKGFECETWLLKRKLWKCYGPGPLRIYKGRHLTPMLSEVLVPETTPTST